MQQIFIDDEPVDIDVMLQRKWGRYAEILLGTCGITDRCVFVWVGFANTVLPIIEAKQTAHARKKMASVGVKYIGRTYP